MRATSHGIADELRRAIDDGRLQVGDRVPSTRQISRDWGVAMATATRALALLRADGLVRSAPGVGTIVVPRLRQRAPSAHARVPTAVPDDDQLVGQAVRLADAEGLAAVTMRRLAAELGSAPMSLYRHVADKDDLILKMMDVALGEWTPERSVTSGLGTPAWRRRVIAAAHGLWRVFGRHPWLASALSLTRPQALRGALGYSEEVLRALSTVTGDPARAFGLHMMIMNWIRGVAINLESEREAEAETGIDADRWTDDHAGALASMIDEERAPTFTATLQTLQRNGYDLDLDQLFAAGLDALLAGIDEIGSPSQAPETTTSARRSGR